MFHTKRIVLTLPIQESYENLINGLVIDKKGHNSLYIAHMSHGHVESRSTTPVLLPILIDNKPDPLISVSCIG